MNFKNIVGVISVSIGIVAAASIEVNDGNYTTKSSKEFSHKAFTENKIKFEKLIWEPNNLKALLFGTEFDFNLSDYPLDNGNKSDIISKVKEKVALYEYKCDSEDGIDRMDLLPDAKFDKALERKLYEFKFFSGDLIEQLSSAIKEVVEGIPNGSKSLKVIAHHIVAIHTPEKVKRVLDRFIMKLAKKLTRAQYLELRKTFVWGQLQYDYLSVNHYRAIIEIIDKHTPRDF